MRVDKEDNPYQAPKTACHWPKGGEGNKNGDNVARRRWSPVTVGLLVDVAVLFLSTLILDGGQTARICAAAMMVHWLGVLYVFVRRWNSAATSDHWFIRYGIFICIPVVFLLSTIVG